ncbi:MAG TPA: hypothetical protein VGW12_14830 [Pyrinomonadaceae bacterium]|nr:hypothetical protein [Pyrinomonadaceae bacterium]
MRKFICVILLLILVPVNNMAQARSRRRVPQPAAESPIGIEFIDFENYTHVLNGQRYKLIGGYYARDTAPNVQWELGMVDGPYYGDLTGDGKNEAVVVLSYGVVEGPHTIEARVYTLQKGAPVILATFPIADSIACELDHYMDLDNGMVRIERINGQATSGCDHNEITEYRWNGTRFMPIGEVKKVRCRCM